MLFFSLLKESFYSGLREIWNHKLRSGLSLAGITIGIFAIIFVLSVVDTFEKEIKDDVNQLGENVIYVNKWPWTFGPDYPWWEYNKRPNPDFEEYRRLKSSLELAHAVSAYIDRNGKIVQYENTTAQNVLLKGVSEGYDDIYSLELSAGRYFSMLELQNGTNSIILGSNIANELFPNIDPLLKTVKIDNDRYKVIGVFEEMGEDMLNLSTDNVVMVPLNHLRKQVNIHSRNLNITIAVKGHEGIPTQEVKDEIRGVMRAERKLHPREKDNFALNEASLLTKQLQSTFAVLEIVGWVIGIFSIFIGGFGIANIMFVSVRERTNIIGIKKALGAKRSTILSEFLLESVVLCLVGGCFGLLLVFGAKLAATAFDLSMTIFVERIILGIGVSLFAGVIAGVIPAYKASVMDPVKAIRFS